MAEGGYSGKYLHVELAGATVTSLPLGDDVLRRLVGGVGLGTWLLLRHGPTGADALAPEAALVVALSPLVGTPLTTSAKFAVVAKSPLTGRVSDALASDRFAIELKRAGTDALVLTGACDAWSLLVVDDRGARIEPCPDLVGLPVLEAEARVRERYGDGYRFFGTGPAGERLVRFATLSGDSRHAGRGGLGAVMGSKRLKGIVVRGTGTVPLADTAAVVELARDLSARSLGPATAKYRELGTVANLLVMNRLSALPTRNFTEGSFEGAERISGEALHALPQGRRVRKACDACTIGCEHVFTTAGGKPVRMEYEGLFALGPLCGVDDREVVLEASALCDQEGIDVISAGGTAAFAMECRERGLLADVPGGDAVPVFGDGPGLLRLLRAVATRETGIGDILAEGSRRAAEHLGGTASRYSIHVKGLELPGYEPRALQTMALGLAVSSRGADHNRSGAYEEDFRPGADRTRATVDKGPAAAATEIRAAVFDSLILCKFLRGVFDDVEAEGARLLQAVTGFDMDGAELRRVGERAVVLRKLYNQREGWTSAEDTLPERLLTEPLRPSNGDGDALTLSREDLDRMIASYYAAHGWTAEGTVPERRLRDLDLPDLLRPENALT